jgi:hypothetical protein
MTDNNSNNRQQDRIYTALAAFPGANRALGLDDFLAFMPMNNFIFVPTGDIWCGGSIDARLPLIPTLDAEGGAIEGQSLKASKWLSSNRPVEQMTWAPGSPRLIKDRLIIEGSWIDREGVRCFNSYRPPTLPHGDASQAGPWINHIRYVYPDDAEHMFNWLAHRVQRPGEKINHALVLGGAQGIGKDTLLEPVRRAIGDWNFSEVSPQQLLGRFNGFIKSVILRVSEARDLGELDRYKFYEHSKVYTAAPPYALRVDEKHLREYYAVNCTGVILTTNHKSNGIYLPPDDRRTYVAWSGRTRDDFAPDYWNNLYRYYDEGGDGHVAAFLAQRDLSGFDPKAPPFKTKAWFEIVDAGRAPEDSEIADVLDLIGWPNAVTLDRIKASAADDLREWLKDRRSRRVVPHRMATAGYTPVRNPYADDGLWKIDGKRQAVYAKTDLNEDDRLRVARGLTE